MGSEPTEPDDPPKVSMVRETHGTRTHGPELVMVSQAVAQRSGLAGQASRHLEENAIQGKNGSASGKTQKTIIQRIVGFFMIVASTSAFNAHLHTSQSLEHRMVRRRRRARAYGILPEPTMPNTGRIENDVWRNDFGSPESSSHTT